MSGYGASAPSSDPNDNYIKELYILNAVFPSLATIAVALRFYSRKLKGVGWWWDDWVAALGVVWAWVFYGLIVTSIQYGNGRHVNFVNPENQSMVLELFFMYQIFYVLLPPTIKLSALLLYKRIFSVDRFVLAVNVMIGVVTCWGISSVIIAIWGCVPASGFWTNSGRCIDFHAWILGFGIPNILLDVTVWGMPIPRIWDMNLPRTQKYVLTLIFMFGLVDCVLAVIRLSGSADSLGATDFTYSWAPSTWWCMIHTCIGLIVVCLPTMRILLTKTVERMVSMGLLTKHTASSSDLQHPPKVTGGHIRDIGLSLSGENERSLHSNTIAMALRRTSDATEVPESEILVKSDFEVESQTISPVTSISDSK